MKRIYKFCIGLILLSAIIPKGVKAQITFENIYPAATHESAKDIIQTADGGFIIAASIETNNGTDLDILLVRTNDLGDTLWRKIYGSNLPEIPNGILASSDGNYFTIGYKVKAISWDYDCYLIKFTPAGDTLFTKTYGGYGHEEGKEIIETSDGNFMIVGASNSTNIMDNNMELIKIDPNGAVLWKKNYGGLAYESARSVKQCNDGGYIVAGKTVDGFEFSKIFLVRTDAAGDTLWTKTYPNTNSLQGKFILVNSDDTFTLAVDDSSAASDSDVRIMKLDEDGIILWTKKFGGSEKDICKMLQHTSDGGFIMASVSRSFGWISPDMWLLKFDAFGDTVWTRHYGGTDHEHCYAVRPTSDDGYVAVGHTRSFNPGRVQQILMEKLNSNGEFGSTSNLPQQIASGKSTSAYPNPCNGKFTYNYNALSSNFTTKSIEVFNAWGEKVYAAEISSNNTDFDLTSQGKGMYLVCLMEGSKIISSNKLIVTN